jgi:hypothetical protein
MFVPSAIIEAENNFLVNPLHAGFPRIRIGLPLDFALDSRLLTGFV